MNWLEPEAVRWGVVVVRGSQHGEGCGTWGNRRPRAVRGAVTFHSDEEDAAVLGCIAQVLPRISALCALHLQHLPRPSLFQLHPPLARQSLPVLVPAHSAPRPGEVYHQL